MRIYDKLIFEDRRKCGRIYIEFYGTKDNETYFIGSYYATTYKEAVTRPKSIESNT